MASQGNKFESILKGISSYDTNSRHAHSSMGGFELKEDSDLSSDLSGGVGAFFVRSVIGHMQIDEHHIFQWHLQNKYMQYLVFNHYAEGCMPKTYSLSALINSSGGKTLVEELFQQHYFLKSTMGHGSGKNNNFDRTRDYEGILTSYSNKPDFDEEWILQKKLKLVGEYRIHTFSKDLINGLTFTISGESQSYVHAEKFLKHFLAKVPASLFLGTLIGWDIGLDDNNHYHIIEANFTGFHPEYRRGFQTTGYVEDNSYGPICCALLNLYWKLHHGCFIDSISEGLLSIFKFYQDSLFYISLFKNTNSELLHCPTDNKLSSAIIYWGSHNNQRTTTLISYFRLANIAEKYFIIVEKGLEVEAYCTFTSLTNIQIIYERSLFTINQQVVIEKLSYLRKKVICCYHVIRAMKLNSALII